MKMQFRKSALWIMIIFCPAIGMLTDSWAAEKYPSKPINVIVGYSAGGITDTVARVSVEAAKGVLGVPMVILNKPGAGSAIGMEILKNSKPDGYTIGVSTTGSLATTRLGLANYDFFNDFTHICHITKWISAFYVSASSPWKNFQEFQAYAKANPGAIKFGAGGMAATSHLCAENLAYETGIKIVHMPMDSDAAITSSLIGGHLQAASSVWMGFGEYAKAGKVRLLVVFSEERLPEFPDVPTAKELGLKGGTKGPVGVVGPRGLSEEVVKTLSEAFQKGTEDPKFVTAMEKLHQPIDYKGPQDFLRELQEYDEWSVKIMKRVGMIK